MGRKYPNNAYFPHYVPPVVVAAPPRPAPVSHSMSSESSISLSEVIPDPQPLNSRMGIAGSKYASTKRELNALINDIRACGAAVDVKLPRIAILGNQSAGKSSLIESISGINLPRDTGTCTRCPFELRLKSSVEDSTWQCQISLRHEFDEHGDAIEHDEELFGAVIYESRLVELQLRRAQLAILNPSVASKEFHTFDVSQCHENASEYPPLGSQKQHPFSANVIVVEISGPDVTDLTSSRNPTYAQARLNEKEFFRSVEPWSKLGPEIKRRCGTENLTAFLSDRLSEYISEKLPGIIQTINASYDESVASINSLPPPPSNEPALELNSICTAFVKDLENHTVGVAGSESLIQACLSVFKQFRARVNDTAPRFLPYEKAKLWDGGNAAAKNYEEPELLRDDSSPHLVSSERKNLEKRFTADLDDVRRQIQISVTRELPMNTPYASKSALMKESVARWPALVDECLESIQPIIQNIIKTLIEKHFGRFKLLKAVATQTVDEQIMRLFETSSMHLKWLMDLDFTPFTLNDHYFSKTRTRLMAHYKAKRQKYNINTHNAEDVRISLAALAKVNLPADKTTLTKLLPDDCFEEELQVMAEARAFFQVAYKRLIDNVPRAIDIDIIKKLSTTTQDALILNFALTKEGGNERARAWLAESADGAAKREELEKKRARLAGARLTLTQFATSG